MGDYAAFIARTKPGQAESVTQQLKLSTEVSIKEHTVYSELDLIVGLMKGYYPGSMGTALASDLEIIVYSVLGAVKSESCDRVKITCR